MVKNQKMYNDSRLESLIQNVERDSLVVSGQVLMYYRDAFYGTSKDARSKGLLPHTILFDGRRRQAHRNKTVIGENTLQQLFKEAEKLGVKCLIFHECRFFKEFCIVPPSMLEEIVISYCENIHHIYYAIFDRCSRVKSITLRGNFKIDDYDTICNLACVYLTWNFRIEYISIVSKITYNGNNESAIKFMNYIDRNNKGRKTCHSTCLIILGLKKYGRAFRLHQKEIIIDVCKKIWSERYNKAWYV